MPTRFRGLEKMLEAEGYEFDHATGSHSTFVHPAKGKVAVPFHGSNVELRPGTLKNVLKQMGVK